MGPTTSHPKSRFPVGNLRQLELKEWLAYLLERGKIGKARAETRLKKMVCKLYLGLGRPLPPAFREMQETTRSRLNPYIPRNYPGKIILFRPSQQPKSCYHLFDMGWSGLAAGGLKIYEVPGRFGAIITEPNVQVMAERLQLCLQTAQTALRSNGQV
jgi:oxalate---CoA ligase